MTRRLAGPNGMKNLEVSSQTAWYAEVRLVVDHSVRNLCSRPYQNHPRGCPNYGKRKSCPPQARTIDDILDLCMPTYVVWNVFDFQEHTSRMKAKHPEWSQRQAECCLYWQGTARKQLRDKVLAFRRIYDTLLPVLTPEACGVNVTATMSSVGEKIEWPPVTKTYQVAVFGSRRR